MAVKRTLNDSRRSLASVLAGDKRRTANELARGVGKPTGAIFGTLRRMHDDGLIWADSDPDPPTRGTLYGLTDAGKEALEATLAAERPLGKIEAEQWILLVERDGGGETSDFERVMSRTELSAAVDWSVWLGWGWLLAFASGADDFQVRRLVLQLEKHGFRCRHASAQEPVAGFRLREQAASLVADLEAS